MKLAMVLRYLVRGLTFEVNRDVQLAALCRLARGARRILRVVRFGG